MSMATSVRNPKVKKDHLVVAVRTVPSSADIIRTTDFVKSDTLFNCVEIDGIAVYQVFRGGKVVASYPAPTVISCRMSVRPFRTHKVTFVRRVEYADGKAPKAAKKS
jgi:hypothetical protein